MKPFLYCSRGLKLLKIIECPREGADANIQGFPLSTYCSTNLQFLLIYMNQPKGHVAKNN